MSGVIQLKPRRAKPFFGRHPWVFSGAVQKVEGEPQKGDVVEVRDAEGRFVARGFFNPDSQIQVRLFSWQPEQAADEALWRGRIASAISMRHDLLRLPERTNACRLVYSDSDLLPGLIADRYGDYLAVQFVNAGMLRLESLVLDCLNESLHPAGILDRTDRQIARMEGIPFGRGLLRGTAPEQPVEISSSGVRLLVDMAGGQKTGAYLDQADNRLAAAKYCAGRSVLDAFCYSGAFGLHALAAGASEVVGLDSSEPAIALCRRNYEINARAADLRVVSVGEEFRRIRKEGRKFGAVILDPPKFAHNRGDAARALRGYRDINLMAMHLLQDGGVLVSCSCSGHIDAETFCMMLNDAAVEAGVGLQILERRGQAPDHPVIASCPETSYLKCVIGRVARG